jgi:hypothetical protein
MNAEVYTHASDKVPGGQWILIKILEDSFDKTLKYALNKQIKQFHTDMLAIIEVCFYEI